MACFRIKPHSLEPDYRKGGSKRDNWKGRMDSDLKCLDGFGSRSVCKRAPWKGWIWELSNPVCVWDDRQDALGRGYFNDLSHHNFLRFIYFCWKDKSIERIKDRILFCLLVHSPNAVMTGTELIRSQEISCRSPTHVQVPRNWAILYCFPRS